MYKVLLTRYKNRILYSYMADDKPLEIALFSDNKCPVGAIFNGRVSDVKKNIDASFVELYGNVKGFLPGCNHKCGDIIPVCIERDPTDLKEARLTEDVCICGEYAVVYMKKGTFKLSSKLTGDIKKSLLNCLKRAFPDNDRLIVIRTNAANCDFDILKEEIIRISCQIQKIEQYSLNRTKSLLYKPDEEWLTAVLNIYRDKLDEIVTDDAEIYEKIKEHGFSCKLYDDNMIPLIKLYSLETLLKESVHKKVWLKSGAFLVIEPTEALVSIDVNSGKITAGKDKDETILKVNLEAAKEVARELRLRNLSGIIIVDFINMKNAKDDAILLKTLREEVSHDPVKTQVHGITSLGLVEITRMKGRRTLYEQIRSVSDDAAVSGD